MLSPTPAVPPFPSVPVATRPEAALPRPVAVPAWPAFLGPFLHRPPTLRWVPPLPHRLQTDLGSLRAVRDLLDLHGELVSHVHCIFHRREPFPAAELGDVHQPVSGGQDVD